MVMHKCFQNSQYRSGKNVVSAVLNGAGIGLTGMLLLGCSVPIPSSIGLRFTDEISISSTDIARTTVMAKKCRDAGHGVDDQFMRIAANNLAGDKRASFEQERDRQMASEDAPTKRECKKLAKDLNRTQDKKLKITG